MADSVNGKVALKSPKYKVTERRMRAMSPDYVYNRLQEHDRIKSLIQKRKIHEYYLRKENSSDSEKLPIASDKTNYCPYCMVPYTTTRHTKICEHFLNWSIGCQLRRKGSNI